MRNRIQEILDETGRKQSFLCERLGKSPNTISSWCRNNSNPSIIDAKRIADLLGVEMDDLLIDDEKEETK